MSNFNLLDYRIQKWIFQKGWKSLHDIQEAAIPHILAKNTDVLISASTAGGKTESFFFPALSSIARDDREGISILCISPLKALINDQYRRAQSLCEAIDVRVTAWHGDSSESAKKQLKKSPSGVLLITPESLEAMLTHEPKWAIKAFSNLQYICIDEFHAFSNTERGQQLLSLLIRLEHLVGRLSNPIPRIALSATMGDLEMVPTILRSNGSIPCQIITGSTGAGIKIQVRGYQDPNLSGKDDHRPPAEFRICKDLFKFCRGTSNLVFANSRARTESISAQLRDFCEHQAVPNEFFPHHGSLAKDSREYLESRLQKGNVPTTGVCTMTLELGLDVGDVHFVGQVNAPHSASSLRQRAGRSGRRDSTAILRLFIAEKELNAKSSVIDCLRMELVQSFAIIRLLISDHWFEPADLQQLHFSTLIHQILAVIAQNGSVRAPQLFTLLCKQGPFTNVTIDDFKILLSHMKKLELLNQLGSGEIVLDLNGEKIVNHYTFFAVFNTPEEYRVIANGKIIGTLPVEVPLTPGQSIVLSGRRWRITSIEMDKKTIYVASAKGGSAPMFCGGGMQVHEMIRKEMLNIYKAGDYSIIVGENKIDYANEEAKSLFDEGVRFFNDNNLEKTTILEIGGSCCIFTWSGDKIANTLSTILMSHGITASNYSGVIEISGSDRKSVEECLLRIIESGVPSSSDLSKLIIEKNTEKFDPYLPNELLSKSYGAKMFDITGTEQWIKSYFSKELDVNNKVELRSV